MKKNNQIHLSFILALLLLTFSVQVSAQCPIPPTKISPHITTTVKVSIEKTKKIYTYTYKVTNSQNAALPLRSIFLLINENPIDVINPPGWKGMFDLDDGRIPSNYNLRTTRNPILPGASATFIIKSEKGPGMIKYFARGKTEMLTLVKTDGDPETIPDCPGFYKGKPMLDSLVSGIIEGPANQDVIPMKIQIRRNKVGPDRLREKDEIRPYHETGLLTLSIKSSAMLNVAEIDISSLRFGTGRAAPVWSEIRPGKECEDKDDDKIERAGNKLWLQFNLDQAEIECDRDRVLFLEGRTKGGRKTILGHISPRILGCEQIPTNPIKKKLWDLKMKFWEKVKEHNNKKKLNNKK